MAGMDDYELGAVINEELDEACYDPDEYEDFSATESARRLLALETAREPGDSLWFPRVRRHLGYVAASLSVGALGVFAPGMRRNFVHDFDKPKPEPYTGIFSRHTPFDR